MNADSKIGLSPEAASARQWREDGDRAEAARRGKPQQREPLAASVNDGADDVIPDRGIDKFDEIDREALR